MPVIYVHGVAVRDQQGDIVELGSKSMLDGMLQDVTWEAVKEKLTTFVAPVLSPNPELVWMEQAYWGDLGARLAWNGASCAPELPPKNQNVLTSPLSSVIRSMVVADLRHPLNQLMASFLGDIFCYLSNRGDATNVGPIPLRVLSKLADAQAIKDKTGEPLIVLSNSMGCEIIYDIVTYFLPSIPAYQHIKVDYWCGVASQVGLFEELKLFLCSSSAFSREKGNRVPFPQSRYLGGWWNVWDVNDLLSYSVADIIEGVDDTSYRVAESLLKEHLGYLQEDRFYRLLAERIKKVMPLRLVKVLPL